MEKGKLKFKIREEKLSKEVLDKLEVRGTCVEIPLYRVPWEVIYKDGTFKIFEQHFLTEVRSGKVIEDKDYYEVIKKIKYKYLAVTDEYAAIITYQGDFSQETRWMYLIVDDTENVYVIYRDCYKRSIDYDDENYISEDYISEDIVTHEVIYLGKAGEILETFEDGEKEKEE